MIKIILDLLEKIPYRTKFGLSIADKFKIIYYQKLGYKTKKCLCGGKVHTSYRSRCEDDVSWETACSSCEFLYDED